MRLALLLMLCGLLAACTAPPAETAPEPTNPSDPFLTIGQAPQSHAPALAASGRELIAVWVGSDERGVHHDALRLTSGAQGATSTLPLPPTHPYAQTLVAGLNQQTHLLWLDANGNGRTMLYSALLNADLSVERGPVEVSDGLALEYSAIADGAGGFWAAWSGGLVAERAISARHSDDAGRPLELVPITSNGSAPALARTASGEVWLFWLANGQLMRQRLDAADTAQALTGTIALADGDQLVSVQAALDETTAYFFWNVTRADGRAESWWTAGGLDATAWRQPALLRDEAGAPLRWAAPLAEPAAVVTAAVESDAGLELIRFAGGEITGVQVVAPGVDVIGRLALVSSGGLALAWAAPNETAADFKLAFVPR